MPETIAPVSQFFVIVNPLIGVALSLTKNIPLKKNIIPQTTRRIGIIAFKALHFLRQKP